MSAAFESEELLVLLSIFGEDCISYQPADAEAVSNGGGRGESALLMFHEPHQGKIPARRGLSSVSFHLPPGYPVHVPTAAAGADVGTGASASAGTSAAAGGEFEFDIALHGCAPKRVYREMRAAMLAVLAESEPGESVLYQAIEVLREVAAREYGEGGDAEDDDDENDEDDDDENDEERNEEEVRGGGGGGALLPLSIFSPVRVSGDSSACPLRVPIVSGEPFTERRSTFQAHFARVASVGEVTAFRDTLLEDRRIQRATHNISAFRFTDTVTGVVHHDYDDDGENAAGGRLAEILRLTGADGVAVIVTRWYGGILLGPDRFKYINNAARLLLEAHGLLKPAAASGRRRARKGRDRSTGD